MSLTCKAIRIREENTKQILAPYFRALDFDSLPPSIANLPAALTINSQTVYPTFRYKGGDAGATSWAPWGYGETLTLQAGTAPSYNQGSPLLGASDDSVKFNAGGYYKTTSAFADIATEDFIVEALITMPSGAGDCMGTFNGSSRGWLFYCALAGRLTLYYQGPSAAKSINFDGLTAGTVYHVIVFVDISGSLQIYVNGVAGTAATASGAGSIATGGAFVIGDRVAATEPLTGNVHYLAMWQGASWLDTHLQATVAQTRFAQLTGVYPQSARGTYLPTAVTRSSAGYLDKVEADGTTKIYYMGSNWPRVCSRKDSGSVTRKGYLSETSVSNTCLQSQVLGTTWALIATATRAADSAVAPDGTTTADTLTAVANADGIKQAFGTITAVQRTYSHYIKRNGSANVAGLIQLIKTSDGALIAQTAFTATSTWERIYVTGTCVVNDTEVRIIINTAGESVYLWGAQVELGNYPSSYIPTTTAAVTRSADCLRYKMDDGNMSTVRGSLECNVLLPDINVTAAWYVALISDGTNAKRIILSTQTTGDEFAALTIVDTSVQTSLASTSDIWNNGWNKLRGIWGPNDGRLLVNSVSEGTQDTSVTVPTGLTQLDVGAHFTPGTELNGLLSNLKILGRNTTRG